VCVQSPAGKLIVLYYAILGGTRVKNTKYKYTIKHTKTENYKTDSKRTLQQYTQKKTEISKLSTSNWIVSTLAKLDQTALLMSILLECPGKM